MDILRALQICKKFSKHKLNSLNKKLLKAIEKQDNDKIVKIIKQKHKILNDPRKIKEALLTFANSLSQTKGADMKQITQRIANEADIDGCENSQHNILYYSQKGDRENALKSYQENITLEQKIIDLYEHGNEVSKHYELISRRGFLKAGIMAAASASLFGGFRKAFAGERKSMYINEWYKQGTPSTEIKGAKELNRGSNVKLKYESIGFKGKNDFRNFYFNKPNFHNLIKKIIEVDYNQFDNFINRYRNSQKFAVGVYGLGYMRVTSLLDGKFKSIVLPIKSYGYSEIKKFSKNNFR